MSNSLSIGLQILLLNNNSHLFMLMDLIDSSIYFVFCLNKNPLLARVNYKESFILTKLIDSGFIEFISCQLLKTYII